MLQECSCSTMRDEQSCPARPTAAALRRLPATRPLVCERSLHWVMVAINNIILGQEVEVRLRDLLIPGKVRYKGPLCGVAGDWVGVELDEQEGDTDGFHRANRYFSCREGFGVFVLPDDVRFRRVHRITFNPYRRSAAKAEVDELLFGSGRPASVDPRAPVSISAEFQRRSRQGFAFCGDPFSVSKEHRLSQSLGKSIRPKGVRAKQAKPVEFISSPSMPVVHMPASAFQRQVRRGWQGVALTRQPTHTCGFEEIRSNQWNGLT